MDGTKYELMKMTHFGNRVIALGFNPGSGPPWATWGQYEDGRSWFSPHSTKDEAVSDYYYRLREAEEGNK